MITDLTDNNNNSNNNNQDHEGHDECQHEGPDHAGHEDAGPDERHHDHEGRDECHHEGPDHASHDHAGPDHAGHDDAGHEGGDPTGTDQRAGLVERALLGAIGLYRMTAPVRTPRCRYIPSCSEYAAEAIEKHGPVRGLWLALRRLGRCHPLGSFGFDPVPDKRPEKNPEKKT